MADDLTISSVTDSQEIVDAVAQNDEGGARTGETAFVSEELPGISRTNNSDSPPRPVHAVSFEHPQSSRIRVQQELDEAEKELSSEQPASEEVEGEPESGVDIEAVRAAATQDAIAHAREQYAREQMQAHLAPQDGAARAKFVDRFRELTKDDTEVYNNFDMPGAVADILVSQPGGAEVAAFLSKNPEQAQELVELPWHLAAAKVGALVAKMNPSAQRQLSAAPKPIRPIGGSPSKTAAIDLSETDYQTFKYEREKQIKAARRSR